MVRECRPPAREPVRSWPARRSTMATSTPANTNSPASIIPVGPPPAITTACSVIAILLPASPASGSPPPAHLVPRLPAAVESHRLPAGYQRVTSGRTGRICWPTGTSAPSARNCTASPTLGATLPRDSYVDNDTRMLLPQIRWNDLGLGQRLYGTTQGLPQAPLCD